MGSTQNLHTLHEEEERLRTTSLATIDQRPDLRDHLAIARRQQAVEIGFRLSF